MALAGWAVCEDPLETLFGRVAERHGLSPGAPPAAPRRNRPPAFLEQFHARWGAVALYGGALVLDGHGAPVSVYGDHRGREFARSADGSFLVAVPTSDDGGQWVWDILRVEPAPTGSGPILLREVRLDQAATRIAGSFLELFQRFADADTLEEALKPRPLAATRE